MQTTFNTLNSTEVKISYDGTQLAPHWIYRQFNLLGNSIVAFQGSANVDISHMVDLEDVKANAPIYSPLMLHFIGEWFIDSFREAILYQHLFIFQIYQTLIQKGVTGLRKQGNDLYYQDRKLSVSICTKSTSSCLMHTGLNLKTEGTPVPTSSLTEMGISPAPFAAEVLENFRLEVLRIEKSRFKTLPRP